MTNEEENILRPSGAIPVSEIPQTNFEPTTLTLETPAPGTPAEPPDTFEPEAFDLAPPEPQVSRELPPRAEELVLRRRFEFPDHGGAHGGADGGGRGGYSY